MGSIEVVLNFEKLIHFIQSLFIKRGFSESFSKLKTNFKKNPKRLDIETS